jgi:hypothetical protein
MKWLTILLIGFISNLIWMSISRCANCRSFFGLKKECSRTMYCDESLNAPLLLCRRCAILHHEYWDDMWNEYHSGCL